MKPIILINFKTYNYGKIAIALAKEIEKVNKNIIIAVQPTDIKEISSKTKLKVYSQHVDSAKPERATGFITPESVKSVGASGVLLNHSEHQIDFKTLKETIKRCKKIKLNTAIFASGLKEAKKIEKLKPTFLIYEPPELVGGKISVSSSKPEIISKIAKSIKTKFLVGAGIKTKEDIKNSIKLGASGVAFASVITTAKNPKKTLKELLI
ncbi:MAG: triose-phosphate isomerase [Candidatus Pacearchaeota archaeon]